MKKLIIIFTLFAGISMSAQETTTNVVLSSKVAREVIVDLIEGDFCEKELKETKVLVNQLEEKVSLQGEVILNKDLQEDLWKKINGEQEEALKKQKRANLGHKILLYGSIGVNMLLVNKLIQLW